ncbi:uncharacterized protein LOC104902807 [Beta vulgaris subsp. vulgaris]|uniref:uncharacterized protein LOC104902807 n=1 Tax=Beta vulgaris subsp. vulgaris TaxID=3555 RepID=UPI00203706B5|nr:uncharacterized protein LOC104902807 [Beta vulgaris subsp. vulgaris]
MVVSLRPGKFYGSSLPRPRIYTDVKLSDERVDPPLPVLDPLLSWANEAHWSMGGLSFKRLRLQGKIEGNVKKLRKEREQFEKNKVQNSTPISQWKANIKTRKGGDGVDYDSPPPAPIAKKRRKLEIFTDDEEDEEDDYDDEEEIEIETKKKRRRLVRKLGDDFELVVSENKKSGSFPLKDLSHESVSEGIGLRTRSRRSMVLIEEEEDDDNVGKKTNTKKGEVEIGKAKKIKEKKNGFVSPIGSRNSPRLKKKSS